MRIDWTIIGVLLTALAVIVGYMQLVRTPKINKIKQSQFTERINLLKKIKDEKSITVGFFNYPPFVEYDNKKSFEPTGYFPSILKRIADVNQIKINWKQTSICNSVEAVINKEVDIIISIFQTPKRAKVVDFCCLLYSVKIGGVAKRAFSGINSLSDLVTNNVKVVIGKNEIGHELIEIYKIPKNLLTIIENEEVSKIVAFVEIGQADVAILDSVSIKNFFDRIYLKKGVSLKPIFQSKPLHMCLNGIMIPQEQHELSNWLEAEVRKYRNEPNIRDYEKDFLEEYCNSISRL